MSDEEWVTTDDSSSETESLHDESDENCPDCKMSCPYCKIYKVMAESRLFKVPEALEYEFEGWPESTEKPFLWRSSKLFYRIKEGSNKGCKFCGLLEDAIFAWDKWLVFVVNSEFKLGWGLQLRDGQFLIEVEIRNYGHISIFRGTGLSIIICARSAIKKKHRLSITVESPRTNANIKRHIIFRGSHYCSPLA
jgi:hypothetical protein